MDDRQFHEGWVTQEQAPVPGWREPFPVLAHRFSAKLNSAQMLQQIFSQNLLNAYFRRRNVAVSGHRKLCSILLI